MISCDQIMKSDEDVRMISAEAPVLFARVSRQLGTGLKICCSTLPNHLNIAHYLQACEMFILELTLRSWNHSEENKRRTLQRNDIAAAITRTDIFDFLVRSLCMNVSLNASCIENYTCGMVLFGSWNRLKTVCLDLVPLQTHKWELITLSCLSLA